MSWIRQNGRRLNYTHATRWRLTLAAKTFRLFFCFLVIKVCSRINKAWVTNIHLSSVLMAVDFMVRDAQCNFFQRERAAVLLNLL